MDGNLVESLTMRARMGATRATMPCLDHALNMTRSEVGCHHLSTLLNFRLTHYLAAGPLDGLG